MKIMHTADWHLGDKSENINRIEEQKKILDEIISIADKEEVDIVVVCGDIYNVANPSSEAEELFFSGVERLSNHGNRVVFIISGNHDDPDRLQAARGLANTHNIVLAGELDLTGKHYKENADVKIIENGYGYVKIVKGNEKVVIAFLPYANNVRMNDSKSELTYAEKVVEWTKEGTSHFESDSFNMMAMHLFIAGSKIKGKEITVGGMLAVPPEILPKCDYVALGHMHTNQKICDNVYYSGSTIRRHVINTTPSLNILHIDNNKLQDVKVVHLKSPVKFVRVESFDIEDAKTKLANFEENDIVELVFKTNEPLSSIALKELKKEFKCIRNIAFELTSKNITNNDNKKLRELSGEELFIRFYQKMRGCEPRKELVDYFIECGGDKNETN